MEFTEFKLHEDLLRGITEAGYTNCMPVQEQVLSHAFGGQDLYVQSQTGTGKTAAFLIVIFQRLLTEPLLHGKKAIIMVPTRELAVQVEEEAGMLGKYLPFVIGSFYGGVGYAQQQRLLRDNVQILVGTPGRVLDLNGSGQMNLMDIAFLVLDEADRMFDMGFQPDLRKLIKVVPPADKRQTMLFSATLNSWVKNLAWEYTRSPFEIEIEPATVTVEEVEQILYHVPSEDKMKLLLGILEREKPESAIIFCNTKRYAEIAAKRLRLNGYQCEFIIGDLPQVKRLHIINDIKSKAVKYLIATDVAARGLDIEGLSMVVNFDLPSETENYVHRIGRTARAGKTGKAVTLVSEQDVYELPAIEKYIGKKIPAVIATAELYAADKSEGTRIHTDFYEEWGDSRSRQGAVRRSRTENRGRNAEGRASAGRGERDKRRRGDTAPQYAAHTAVHSERNFREDRGEQRGKGGGSRAYYPHKIPETAVDLDISRLSFDERMAYYKQKYETGSGKMPARNVSGYTPSVGDTETKPADENSPGKEPKKRSRRRNRGRRREGSVSDNGEKTEQEVARGGRRRHAGRPAGGGEKMEQEDVSGGGRKRQEGRGEQGRKNYGAPAKEQAAGTDTTARASGAGPLQNAKPSAVPPSVAQEANAEPKKGFLSRLAGLFKKPKGSAPDSPSAGDK
ncbi:MAG: DEAD/DEAH box helicase [Treponema sp.]|jgi:ATP-dependent RNA helicase RhlB|nr:DEAD/DEAH box helicase [Treponema sp.]